MGDQVQYFFGVPCRADIKKLYGKGVRTETGVLSLWECLPGEEETTFVSPSAVMARVGDRQLTIHQKNNESACFHNDLRRKDVVSVENPTSGARYEALVVTESADNIRVEMSLSEVCTLPDGQHLRPTGRSVTSDIGLT